MNQYQQIIEELINTKSWKATRFISTKQIIRAVRTRYGKSGKKKFDRTQIEINLTIGKPNYLERKFIAGCKKDGMVFPLKQTLLKY